MRFPVSSWRVGGGGKGGAKRDVVTGMVSRGKDSDVCRCETRARFVKKEGGLLES